MNSKFLLDSSIGSPILIGQVGSKSYGISTPESDDDWMGIVVAPISHYIGLKSWKNDGSLKIECKEDNEEFTAYELKKFFRLMLAFNPNVVPLLYLREQDYTDVQYGGKLLIDNRKRFESARAGTTLIGYSESQLKMVLNLNTGKLGQKRKELVAKYGYDVKYAAHTIRLLNMAIEFFETGILNVYRTWDRDILLSIKKGKYTLIHWVSWVEQLLEQARIAEKKSSLPEDPDFDFVNDLCMDIIEDSSGKRY